ncbi:MAG: methionine synthase [Planctomycetota bacterium]|nr:MAG: methionine synthase [Planctomycetota bacterium]
MNARRRRLEDALAQRVLLLDGGMGTQLQARALTADDFGGAEGCNEVLVLTRPEVVRAVHQAYRDAGADILETDSFGASPIVLAEYGLAQQARAINAAAAALARAVAGADAWVAGSIGPTNRSLSLTGGATFDEMVDAFRTQALGLVEGGADFLLVETCQDTLNTKAALIGIEAARQEAGFDAPVAVSATLEPNGRMLAGQTIEAFWASVRHAPLLYISLNCGTGPDQMTDAVRALHQLAPLPLACVPNAGLPNAEGGYDLGPEPFAAQMAEFARHGWLNLAGGCCGTTPAHIAALAAALAQAPRRAPPRSSRVTLSGLDELELTEDVRPVLVGERTNVVGSRKFRRLIEDERFDEAAEVGRLQVQKGGQVLDVCMASSDRDELADMLAFLPKLLRQVRVPLMIDSTDARVIAAALPLLQGRSILNSINLEDGLERFDAVVPLARRFGAALVVGCIDEDPENGMAVTLERKLEIAERSRRILHERYGVADEDILFDALVFPIGTGDQKYARAGLWTLEGVEQLKQRFPACRTILGISNVSFGLPEGGREVLNSVFLYHATQRGLDLAIVNTEALARYASIPLLERDLAEDLLFCRDPAALARFSDHFRDAKSTKTQDDWAGLSLDQRLARYVVEGRRAGLVEDLEAKRAGGSNPLDIINGPLMAGMDEVGRLFNDRKLIVAEVLQSAEVMKAAVAHLQPFMEKSEGARKGRLILATVKGDVHDIGKNLVDILFSNNGFEVVNLGIKVPPHELTRAVRQHQPDLVGLSGLLVKSTQQMVATAQDLAENGVALPLLVGGAALTRRFTAERIAPVYQGPVYYAPDAMAGLDLGNRLMDPARRAAALRAAERPGKAPATAATVSDDLPAPARLDLVTPLQPPQTRRTVLEDIPLDEVFSLINPDILYGKHLGLRGKLRKLLEKGDTTAEKLHREVQGIQRWVQREGVLAPRAVYRFFRCGSEGDSVLVSSSEGRLAQRFTFPRQARDRRLCIADFVRPLKPCGGHPPLPERAAAGAAELDDWMALFVVTAGSRVEETAARLKDEGEYLRSFALQALALETAEATAEWLHRELRALWGFPDGPELTREDLFDANYRGKRMSFGYPACPDLEDQAKLFALLEGAEDIGVTLTDEFMMSPEASVSALVFHHPQARYFSV